MKKLLLSLALIAAPFAAYAEPDCVPEQGLIAVMEGNGGKAVFRGLAESQDHYVTIWVMPSGAWGLFVTSLDMVSCMLASGSNYQGLPPNA